METARYGLAGGVNRFTESMVPMLLVLWSGLTRHQNTNIEKSLCQPSAGSRVNFVEKLACLPTCCIVVQCLSQAGESRISKGLRMGTIVALHYTRRRNSYFHIFALHSCPAAEDGPKTKAANPLRPWPNQEIGSQGAYNPFSLETSSYAEQSIPRLGHLITRNMGAIIWLSILLFVSSPCLFLITRIRKLRLTNPSRRITVLQNLGLSAFSNNKRLIGFFHPYW